jgi:archaetidylinositol phosphate synthase
MEQGDFRSAERVQRSVLAGAEKRALIWMAQRLPRWVTSDLLTLLGLMAMIGVALSYWFARHHRSGLLLVIVFLALNWFGDSLDGTVARVRNQQRPRYGFYVDHMVDTFNTLFLVGGLALSGYISLPVGAAALIAFYMVSIEVYLATYALGAFHMSFAGFGPTEMRILIAVGNLWLYFHAGVPMAHVFGRQYLLFDVGGAIASAGMVLMAALSAIRHTRQLYQMERI